MTAAERTTAATVKAELGDHLQYHENKLDPKLHNHHVILFGEKGDNGLCSTAKDHEFRIGSLEKLGSKIDRLVITVIGGIIVEIFINWPKIMASLAVK